ncbi:MAG: TrkH family potassium uptake protein, partial [Clostridia bacterium]|nr:TrkH family potassium uptake protein [Clostridia bacterium]
KDDVYGMYAILWIGGVGILALLSVVLPSWGVNGQTVAFNESTGPSKGKLTSRFSDNSKILYKLYLILTVSEITLLIVCGMTPFDAVLHSFATVATGGFSNYNNGLMHFTNPAIHIVIVVFMTLSGINFSLMLQAKNRKGLVALVKDEEVRCYLGILTVSTLIIWIYNMSFFRTGHYGQGLLDSAFQVVSIVTTTGFSSADYDIWPAFSRIVIFTLFFTGGCSSSTAGGIKCVRLVVWWKLIKRNISLRLHPNRIAKITLNDKEMNSDTVIRVTTFLLTFFTMLAVGTFLISFDGYDIITSLSAAASSIGNVGPGFNLVGPTMNYQLLSNCSKVVCTVLMIAGRLEILTIFMLFSRDYWNPDRIH